MNTDAPPSGYHFGYKTLMLALFPGGRPPQWRDQAACRGTDPETFTLVQHMGRAKELCSICPVLAACRADQLAWEQGRAPSRDRPIGVVGGMTGPERRAVHYPPAPSPAAPAVLSGMGVA
ncbi:WhiB family transcriptional regulator [Crossiella sp. SN42]|uniref:WhiB family transcriptional regulator n=1 Tax=Crossiella sp. SN42 TaxID=2944808 RepID=UPI00207C870F|nr:WhiB family transcriptional regulator [Crossiella sp. SN42]MCO1577660.1 WhiB family transcriptional regulator [Crossiella sp. SN42]